VIYFQDKPTLYTNTLENNQVLTKDEGVSNICLRNVPVATPIPGGRYTPFMMNYRPQLFLRTADITVALTFPEGTHDAAEKMVTSFL
jgi:translation elongation factor EF-Tu-like GTPase